MLVELLGPEWLIRTNMTSMFYGAGFAMILALIGLWRSKTPEAQKYLATMYIVLALCILLLGNYILIVIYCLVLIMAILSILKGVRDFFIRKAPG